MLMLTFLCPSEWSANRGADSTWAVRFGAYRRRDKDSLPHTNPVGKFEASTFIARDEAIFFLQLIC